VTNVSFHISKVMDLYEKVNWL